MHALTPLFSCLDLKETRQKIYRVTQRAVKYQLNLIQPCLVGKHILKLPSCQSSKLGECYIEVSDFQEKQEDLIQSELMFSTLKLSQAGLNSGMPSVPAHLVHQSCYFSDLKYSFYQFFENFVQSVLIMFTLLPPTLLKSTPLNFVSLPQPYQGQFVLANILGCVAIH